MKIFVFHNSDDSAVGVIKDSLKEAFEAFSAFLKKQDTGSVVSDEITIFEDKLKVEQKITYRIHEADSRTYTIKHIIEEVKPDENGVFLV